MSTTSPNYIVRVGIPGLQGAGFDASTIRAECLASQTSAAEAAASAASAASIVTTAATSVAAMRDACEDTALLAQTAASLAAEAIVRTVSARDEAVAARDAARSYREYFTFRGEWSAIEYDIGNMVELNGSTYVLTTGDGTIAPPGNGWSMMAAKGTDGTGITLLALDGGAPDAVYLSGQAVDGGLPSTWS